jgi:drug/metabolite transporter (DMT)-like permease
MNQDTKVSPLTNKYVVIGIAIFCSLLWGSAFPVLKVSYAIMHMAPNDLTAKIVFAGIRFFLAGLFLIIGLIIFNPKSLRISKSAMLPVLLLGLLSTSLQYFFFYNGLAHTTGIKGAILSSSGTFFVVLLANFVYTNDKLDWKKTVGILCGFGGIIVANWGEDFSLHFSFMGEGFMILAGLTNAVSTLLAKRLAKNVHPFALTGWNLTLGAIILLAVGLPQLKPHAMIFSTEAWILIIYAAFLSATAFALWFSLLKYNKAGEISIYKFITPVAGSALSAFFLPGESLTITIIGALGLVAVGIIAVNYNPKRLLTSKRSV